MEDKRKRSRMLSSKALAVGLILSAPLAIGLSSPSTTCWACLSPRSNGAQTARMSMSLRRRPRGVRDRGKGQRLKQDYLFTVPTPAPPTQAGPIPRHIHVPPKPPIRHVEGSHHEHSHGHARHRLPSQTVEWRQLKKHAEYIKTLHLRDMIQDPARSDLVAEHDGIYMDYSRQQVTPETMKQLIGLAKATDLEEKIKAMAKGEKINFTEGRSVLHMATRSARDESIMVDGVDVVQQVHAVLDKIKQFSDDIRTGKLLGATGKRIRNIVAVGIGGSFLGPACIHEVFKTEEEGRRSCGDFRLRFLSNVDPVDVARAQSSLNAEETLVIVVSKSFTTAETMLNARSMRQWLWDKMGNAPEVVAKHMAACASTSASKLVETFGIPLSRLFEFWDWVGGRYSVCASPGALPISLKFGFSVFEKFLAGARSIDRHFLTAPLEKNLPVLMGLLGIWNMSFLGYKCRTIIPYAEALMKFPAHIQQVDMESNGKHTTVEGQEVDYAVGEIDFGEPGTNGQHSFFQLLHMGQVVPVDFIGFAESQAELHIKGEELSSHDELMSNFFAQPDALAIGKTAAELLADGVPRELIPHRTFKGNRPSLSLLFPRLNAYTTGQLLALYEHRTAVQGFVWCINSFDQWGVELGKQLASNIRREMKLERSGRNPNLKNLVPSTARMLQRYWKGAASASASGGDTDGEHVVESGLKDHAGPQVEQTHSDGSHH